MSNPRPRAEVAHEEFDFVTCSGVRRPRLGVRENIRFRSGTLSVQPFQQFVQSFRHRNLARLAVASSPFAGPERHRSVGEVNVFPCHVTDFGYAGGSMKQAYKKVLLEAFISFAISTDGGIYFTVFLTAYESICWGGFP